jgi:hypothetical protein
MGLLVAEQAGGTSWNKSILWQVQLRGADFVDRGPSVRTIQQQGSVFDRTVAGRSLSGCPRLLEVQG